MSWRPMLSNTVHCPTEAGTSVLCGGVNLNLSLVWQESGGPPVSPAQHEGFGSHLVGQAFSGGAGEAKLELKLEGSGPELKD